ncbi:MAG: hypothetical protein GY881_15150 [Gammaproteobacteria bacterium]|jgi:hypothetical protein|nr:hypothetical protein [Gammaproteobacteria bacterium]
MISKHDAEHLLRNDTFIKVFDIIRKEQVDKFINTSKDDINAREEAHDIVLALKKIENRLQSVITDEAIKDKRKR